MSFSRPTWFALDIANSPALHSLSDEVVGLALKLALDYFQAGTLPPDDLNPLTFVAFSIFRASADKALADYDAAVEAGKYGARVRAERQRAREPKPP